MKTFHFVIRIVVITCWLMWAMISLTCAQVDDLKNISDRVGLGSIYQQRPPAKNTAVYPRHGLNADTSSFYRQRLYAPGDYGSANWRIPAILALSDGSLLAVNDKRKFNEGDLPQDIDIVARRSTDNGRTWSDPVTIAAGKGVKKGFGDPALVETGTGEVICVFAGGNGYFQSTEEDPIRLFVSRSLDGGKTWSKPEDITSQIWGSKALNPAFRQYRGSFFSSGNGLRLTRGLHKGRIMFAVPMLRKDEWVSDNFVVYSDDDGHSWQVSECASEDGGVHWGTQGYWPEMTTNACNGDMIRLSAIDQGGKQNVLMHSIPNSMDRENVTIFFSYDEGKTWQEPLLLFNGPSVYSSLTILKDGSVGAYVEQNPNGACELWFIQIPKKW